MAHTAEIIAVGTDLLLGNIANTNAQEISQALSALGINVYWHTVVGDNAGRVREAAALYRVALETYVRLVQENPARWEPELAFLYENLAAFESRRSATAGKALLQSAWTLYQKYPDLSEEAERVRAQIRAL